VAGSEGWGILQSTGGGEGDGTRLLNGIPNGSLVTIGLPGMGTLRSSLPSSSIETMMINGPSILPIPKELWTILGPSGSTLSQLGGTALRMLTDFVSLSPGDVILQTAGNSGVGMMVSQLSQTQFGTSTVSLVRRGPNKSAQDMDEMIQYLLDTGKNAMVIVEEDLEDVTYRKEIQSKLRQLSSKGNLPKLALNSVGGTSVKHLLRLLDDGGTVVTYGGMSTSQPSVTIAPSQLIFKDCRIVGYWHSRWMVHTPPKDKQIMMDQLAKAVIEKGVVTPPCEVFPLRDITEALEWHTHQNGGIRRKLVFDCRLES